MRSTALPVALLLFSLPALAQGPGTLPGHTQRAIRAFNLARANPLDLHAFLIGMPKGADLHMHLSGAIYAETFLKDAIADNLCIDPKALALVRNSAPPCAPGQVAATDLPTHQKLYDDLVDSFSMRGFVPTPGITGHDQFFATFERFGGLKSHTGEWLDEVATRAAAQNEQYLEVMITPAFTPAATIGYKLGWPDHAPGSLPASNDERSAASAGLAHLRDQLLAAPSFHDNIAADHAELTAALAARTAIEHCGTPQATAACAVEIRILFQVLRAFPPQQVFAQTLLGFELASADPNVVGINFVQPEDAYMAMSEYHRQMLMLDFLHTVYPKVHISLHAGELAPGLVPPEGLRFHIREAIDLGHAERIGHGVDVMFEDNPHALLKDMAERHIMTEINLTSNDVILGVSLNRHSLPAYRAAHVPVALSTDDEGVSRIDLTHEYARAVVDHGLGYLDLRNMARTSLEHSFLPGQSLWEQPDSFTRPVAACAAQTLGGDKPTLTCTAFLHASQRATQQWELEHRYTVFESTLP